MRIGQSNSIARWHAHAPSSYAKRKNKYTMICIFQCAIKYCGYGSISTHTPTIYWNRNSASNRQRPLLPAAIADAAQWPTVRVLSSAALFWRERRGD
jgi:hypothetical protein